ncbi:unnamed protein product [Candida verbasci]|uniref:Uncharacterized protein n=1 Tax=Candida verbasci TaxID=1227364 RepID=A0A9W4TXD8_9ASCO|nr:unnamed protein product [Candida verbasci]
MSNSTVPTLKVILLGDSGVGKTCLRSQFIYHIFTNAYKATIGGDYLTTIVNLENGNKVNLQIWDTAGQERFNSISQAFYRGADFVLLVYDITNYESLLSLKDWFKRFISHCRVESPGVIIIGNKMDKVNERCIDIEEVRDILTNEDDEVNIDNYIEDWDDCLVELSSKKLESIENVFLKVAQMGVTKSTETRPRKLQDFDNIDLRNGNHEVKNNCAC